MPTLSQMIALLNLPVFSIPYNWLQLLITKPMTAVIASHITTSPPSVVSVNVFPKSREKLFCATCFGNDPALSMIYVSQERIYPSIYKPSQLGRQSFKRVSNCLAELKIWLQITWKPPCHSFLSYPWNSYNCQRLQMDYICHEKCGIDFR